MCLTLIAALAVLPQSDIEVDEITMGGSRDPRHGGPEHFCSVSRMSADGQVVVGTGTPVPDSDIQGFRWTKDRGTTALNWPAGHADSAKPCNAGFVSGDGHVVGGLAVWLQPESAIARRFTQSTVAASSFGVPAGAQSYFGPFNRDGSVAVVSLGADSRFFKLFQWKPSGLTPLKGKKGERLVGTVMDMSSDGKVMAGFTTKGERTTAFAISNGKFLDIPIPKAKESYAQAVTSNGKVVLGNYVSAEGWRAFRWTVGSKSIQPLVKGLTLVSTTGAGDIYAGPHYPTAAVVVGSKITYMTDLVGGKFMTREEAAELDLVAIKQVGSKVIILADSDNETTDYRITVPLARLK